MYAYEWDEETGGYCLKNSHLLFSKEPRPVYSKELDILGFDKYWNYEDSNEFPYLWAESSNYFYRGRLVAKVGAGGLDTAPAITLIENPEPEGEFLKPVDIPAMVEKNRDILESLVQETIKNLYNTYYSFRDKIDVFYVAFSGGKDSIVALNLALRALPHEELLVLFGDTGMEFPDTYEVIKQTEKLCQNQQVPFLRAKSKLDIDESWNLFGPPAVTNRWCCSVHKTTPQIIKLRDFFGDFKCTGMAITGVRADESVMRKNYKKLSFGDKHNGQYSYHAILDWNSAELFAYIFQEQLLLNESYKKGIPRAGCLMCPMSMGKHEFLKQKWYPDEVKRFVKKIKDTSGKTNFSDEELSLFIAQGGWKTRKSGRELNFGYDKHSVEKINGKTVITLEYLPDQWKEWIKTIGEVFQLSESDYIIDFREKSHKIHLEREDGKVIVTFPDYVSTKDDIKFVSLVRSTLIKSLYCISCGECEANCPYGYINMDLGLHISDECKHCYKCHDIYASCLRYNSIRNTIKGEKLMKEKETIDRYYSFGIKKEWMDLFLQEQGSEEFWESNGDGMFANKRKQAFIRFLEDAGLIGGPDRKKSERLLPTRLAEKLFSLGGDSETSWAMMLCNLAYRRPFKWFLFNYADSEEVVTPDLMRMDLEEEMPNDQKNKGKRNIISAFKFFLVKTPLGEQIGLGIPTYTTKQGNGEEKIFLESFRRSTWKDPDPLVLLYALYLYAAKNGGYNQFTLSRLFQDSIEEEGISPARIFNLSKEQLKKLLIALSINYPELISVQFNLDLETINLNPDKKASDVIELIA